MKWAKILIKFFVAIGLYIGLEQLIADPPELLLDGEVSSGGPTWAERMVQHPALRHLQGTMVRATFPAQQLYCGGPVMELALRTLVRARDAAAVSVGGSVR